MNSPEFPEFLRRLFGAVPKSCYDCDQASFEEVGDLTPSEIEEYNSIQIEDDRLYKKAEELMLEKEMLGARRKIFWGKLEQRFNMIGAKTKIKDNKAIKITCNLPPGESCP